MSHHRGLTLLEVLAATVLLAAIAAACIPMLASATHAFDPAPAKESSRDLVRLSQMFCDDPSAFGVTDLQSMRDRADFQVEWPEALAEAVRTRSAVTVHCLHARSLASGDPDDHLWLVFEHDGRKVMGWLALPEPATKGEAKP